MAVRVDTASLTLRRTGAAETLFDLDGPVANPSRTPYGVAEDGSCLSSSVSDSINVIPNCLDDVERRVRAR